MWQDLFVLQVPLQEKVLRSALVYLLLWGVLRISGKRGMASLNTLDFIVLFVLASSVENALLGEDNSVLGAAVSVTTLVGLNTGLRYLANSSPTAARILQGKPTTVIKDGHFDHRALKRLGIRPSELDHAIRSQNGDDLHEVHHGELTPSGQIVLTLKYDEQSATKADVAALAAQLRHLETLLAARR